MRRRQLYPFVEALLERAGSGQALLEACAEAMKALRSHPQCATCLTRELLADDSACELLRADDALGQIYQALNAPLLEGAYRDARRAARKFERDEIPAVTQLFTPRWVVEFLLHNTLGRLWLEIHPDSSIPLPRLLRRIDPPIAHPHRLARDLRLLDPACGTMNFGIVAAELLEAMYREEMDRAGGAGWPAEPSVLSAGDIGASIARHNLRGIDIDPVVLRLARRTLSMKLGIPDDQTSRCLRRADALFDELPDESFDVVVTNPPYLSARNLPRWDVERMKRRYRAGWRDAYTCFIERCLELVRRDDGGGRVGMLAMQSFMFTGSFEMLRRSLDESAAVEAVAHFGPGLFEVGNPGTLQTAAVVMRRETDAARRAAQTIIAVRAVDAAEKEAALRDPRNEFRLTQSQLMRSPRRAWCYWLDDGLRRAFTTRPRLADVAPPRQGLATTDNTRFVRMWWEVEPFSREAPAVATPGRWFPYAKGGRFRRWYGAPRHRVHWEDDGAAVKQTIVRRYPYLNGNWGWVAKNTAFYGREGITYSYLTSGRFSARRLEAGAIFDVAGSSLFPDDSLTLLGVLNSSSARRLLGAINPTVNFQVGDLAQLPVPASGCDELRAAVADAIEVQRQLDAFDETSPDFLEPLPWDCAADRWHALHGRLSALERDIDGIVGRLYGLDPPPLEAATSPPFEPKDLAHRWVSFALMQAVKASPDPQRLAPVDPAVVHTIREFISDKCGSLDEIDEALRGIATFLQRRFYAWHVRLYQRRPTLWALGRARQAWVLAHDRADSETVGWILAETGGTPPAGWERHVDDGIRINLAPLRRWVCDSDLRARLEQVASDGAEGRLVWSKTWGKPLSPGPSRGCASAPARRLPPAGKPSPGARPART